jgi:hypothetical protein
MSLFRKVPGVGQAHERPQVRSWDQRPRWMRDGLQVQLLDGGVDLEVVMRTGLSEAFATDGINGTPHLSWMRDLPGDDIRAISTLRKLLVEEVDPLDRHFMYAQLETLLYRSREVFASALRSGSRYR